VPPDLEVCDIAGPSEQALEVSPNYVTSLLERGVGMVLEQARRGRLDNVALINAARGMKEFVAGPPQQAFISDGFDQQLRGPVDLRWLCRLRYAAWSAITENSPSRRAHF
jgi:hypothetical protein